MTQVMLTRMLLKEGFNAQQIVHIISVLDMPGIMNVDVYSKSNLNYEGFTLSKKSDGEGYTWYKIP